MRFGTVLIKTAFGNFLSLNFHENLKRLKNFHNFLSRDRWSNKNKTKTFYALSFTVHVFFAFLSHEREIFLNSKAFMVDHWKEFNFCICNFNRGGNNYWLILKMLFCLRFNLFSKFFFFFSFMKKSKKNPLNVIICSAINWRNEQTKKIWKITRT